ncbi:MAG: PAS domain S-box protein [Holophagaceae bacterium]
MPTPPDPARRGRLDLGLRALRLAGLLLAAACFARAAAPERVAIQLKWRHQFQFAGYYAAERMGYFRDEGLEVELREGGREHPPLPEVAAGRAEYGVGDAALLVARAQGTPVVVVAVVFQRSPYVLMTRQGDGIRSPRDLEGRRVMAEDEQGFTQIKAMLLRGGADPDKVHFQRHSWDIRDLTQGRTDAMSGYAPVEPFQLEALGTRVSLLRPVDYGVDFYGDCLFTTDAEDRKHPARVRAVRRAVLKGWTYALEHPAEVCGWIQGMPGVRERGVGAQNLAFEAAGTRELIQASVVPLGESALDRWQHTLEAYQQVGILPPEAKVGDLLFEPHRHLAQSTLRALLLLGAALGGLAALAAAWAFTLRREVRRRVAAHEEAEGRFGSLVESAPDGIFIEQDGRFVYLNPSAAALFGLPDADSSLDAPVSESVLERDRALLEHQVQRTVAAGLPARPTELALLRPDGTRLEVEAILSPTVWKGRPATQAILRDLTQRRAAERERSLLESRFQDLFSTIQEAFFLAEVLPGPDGQPEDWRFMEVNPAYCRIMGTTRELTVGHTARELFPGLEPEWFEAIFRTSETGRPGHRVGFVEGTGRWYESHYNSTRKGQVACLFQDVTERVEAERALADSEDKYRHLVEDSPDCIFISSGGLIRFVNASGLRLFEALEPGELLGRPMMDLVHPEDLPVMQRRVEHFHRTGESLPPQELRVLGLRGGVTPVEVSTSPIAFEGRPAARVFMRDISRRLAAEAREREAQALIRAVFLESPLGMLVTRASDLRIQDANPAFHRLFGYARSEVLGHPTSDFNLWVDPEARIRHLETVAREGQDETDATLHRKDGRLGHFHISGIRIEQEGEAYLLGIFADVTERVETLQEVQAARRYAQATLDAQDSHICVLDEGGTILSVNEAWTRFGVANGGDPARLGPGMNYFDACRREGAAGTEGPAFAEGLRRVLEGSLETFVQEYPCPSPAEERWFLARITRFPLGGAARAVISHHDITPLKEAEEALRRESETFSLVFQATQDALWSWDLAQGTLQWGRGLEACFGHALDQVPPTMDWWFATIHPEDRPRVRQTLEAALAGGAETWSDEYRFGRADGTWAQVLDRGSIQRGLDGRPVRMVGALVDLTERRLAEEAQAANRAKSDFLATMTHELRTPLIGMLGLVEMLAQTRLDPQQRKDLDTLHASARSLLELIGGILDFSKIDAGQLELELQPVSLRSLAEGEQARFAGAAAGKGLRLDLELDPALAQAHLADPLRLRQILANLLANAIKFTLKGSVTLALRVEAEAEGAQSLALSVQDTGIGISPENQARLFQPFVQADSSTTRRFGGTGLGLVICRRLGELMGGSVELRSEAGVGTTVTLRATFPKTAAPSPAPETGRPWVRKEPPSREVAEASGRLVLLVEDHPTNRHVLVRQLSAAGHCADVAEDGVAALEAMARHRYGVVLTDIHMPRMDGYALAREIRRRAAAAGEAPPPVLALTANAVPGELERCLEAGMSDCILKPVTIPALDAKVRQWLEAREPAPGVGPAGEPDARASADVEFPITFVGEPEGSGGAAVDPAVLLELTGGDAEEARTVLAEFIEATLDDVALLRTEREAGRTQEMARQAHRIKGSSLTVGAAGLARLAKSLEQSAGLDAPETDALLDELARSVEALARATGLPVPSRRA